MLALLEEGEVSVLSWRAVAITVISRRFARFTGKPRPGLRPRATPCFPVNQRVLRDFMDSRGDRLLLCIDLPAT